MHSGWWGLSRERKSACYVYDMIIFLMGFSFVLSPFQYHNVLQKAQMRYRLLESVSQGGGIREMCKGLSISLTSYSVPEHRCRGSEI